MTFFTTILLKLTSIYLGHQLITFTEIEVFIIHDAVFGSIEVTNTSIYQRLEI